MNERLAELWDRCIAVAPMTRRDKAVLALLAVVGMAAFLIAGNPEASAAVALAYVVTVVGWPVVMWINERLQ